MLRVTVVGIDDLSSGKWCASSVQHRDASHLVDRSSNPTSSARTLPLAATRRTALAALLPQLIGDAKAAREHHQGIDRARCAAVLARAYKLTGEPSAYRSLLCTAAYASAQAGNRAQAVELLDEAGNSANVNIYRIGVYDTLGELGRAGVAAV